MAEVNPLTIFTGYRGKTIRTGVLVLFSVLLVLISVLLMSREAEAAALSVTPQFREFNDKETLVVDVRLNSEYEVINAVQATIVYPAHMLEVVEMSRGGSFLTLWPEEPQNNKNAGTISLAGGIPHGSLVVDGRVVRLIFRPKAVGDLEIGFDNNTTSVHLNDGQGTPADLTLVSGLYKITPASFVSITSPTHPDEEKWYRHRSPIFQWSAKEDVEYSYALTKDPTKLPDNLRDSTRGEVSYADLPDGIHYFILKEKVAEKEWAVVGKRRAMIDATPPLPFQALVSREQTIADGQYFLTFSTSDATAGLDHYNVIEGTTTYYNVRIPYVLNDQLFSGSIVVQAVDKAGNTTPSSVLTIRQRTPLVKSTLYFLILGALIVLAGFILLLLTHHPRHRD